MATLQDIYYLQNSLSMIFDRIGITQEIRDDISLDEFSPQEQDQLTLLIEKFEFSFEEIRNQPNRIEETLDQRLLIRLGNYYYYQGDMLQALELYDFSNHVEENEWAYFNSAKILQIQENLQPAYEKYEQAIKLKPDFPQALRHQAEILNSQGETELALRKLLKSQKLNPNDPETNKLLADYYTKHGDKKEALVHLKAIHHRDPDVSEKIEKLEKKESFLSRIFGRSHTK